jgi:hypothetical protein
MNVPLWGNALCQIKSYSDEFNMCGKCFVPHVRDSADNGSDWRFENRDFRLARMIWQLAKLTWQLTRLTSQLAR